MNTFIINIANWSQDIDLVLSDNINENKSTENFAYHDFIRSKKYCYDDTLVWVLGDCINGEKEDFRILAKNSDQTDVLKKLKGLFYILILNKKTKIHRVYSSIFSLLPVFYFHSQNRTIISSSLDHFVHLEDLQLSTNKKYLLEQFLFNYPIFDHTFFNEVLLLPANSELTLESKGLSIKKYFSIEDLFISKPKKWRKSISPLTEVFLKELNNYYPDEPFWITFTGGFDGRTLVSAALQQKKTFSTFAFGRPENDDIYLPQEHCEQLGILFKPIHLESEEYVRNFLNFGNEVSIRSGGELSHIYNHFLYSARSVSNNYQTVLTGFCGSELLRSPHSTGSIITRNLKDFLLYDEVSQWKQTIDSSFKKLKHINHEMFESEFNELIEQLIEYKENRFKEKELNQNQKLYVFLFEEAFRKFFGNWIKVQNNYINIRVPYLDYTFVEELLKTELAGVNNKYFTNNPILRFKGQALYSNIIKKTNPEIYLQKTGKGYRPKDLMNLIGYMHLIANFSIKRINRRIKTTNIDNLSILSGLYWNRAEYLIEKPVDLYNYSIIASSLESIKSSSEEVLRDELTMALSQIIYFNYLNKT